MFGLFKRSGGLVELKAEGLRLQFSDEPASITRATVVRELRKDDYRLKEISFQPGDIVVDIGAHVGMFSIFVAKRYPFVKVYAFEPIRSNFEHLRQNLARNDVANVEAFNLALTQDGRELRMGGLLDKNSGGMTAHSRTLSEPKETDYVVRSTTLKSVFDEHEIAACKLLKIDCEGSEYEILMNFPYLDRIEHLRGEFHTNLFLRNQGYTIDGLVEHCQRFVKPRNMSIVRCDMAE
jgi:FkbM family methyltransferase